MTDDAIGEPKSDNDEHHQTPSLHVSIIRRFDHRFVLFHTPTHTHTRFLTLTLTPTLTPPPPIQSHHGFSSPHLIIHNSIVGVSSSLG
ncbi:hypothetical protein L1987_11969 [Smallanthus sonchifolius]|uniref:Uncharacterized protein n=1 Tax=Smallanthus sonchifolius TaxID=185202 RepID=A0ACB9JDB9_9ASTR|nr:hypothetical protein L1987_11969 [Smallanthus sonchifolius]